MLIAMGWLVLGLATLVWGGDRLVDGAVALAARLGLSSMAIGLTVVAFGISAPELAVSLQGALEGRGDLAVGNVVGSNIFNVLIVLGLAAVIATVGFSREALRRELPLVIVVSLVVWGLASNGHVGRLEGGLLVLAVIAFTIDALRRGRAPETPAEAVEDVPPPAPISLGRALAWVAIGLAALALGARWTTTGAVDLARGLGIGERVIGLTIVATGTSLPEVVASIAAARRGDRDMAVGNVLGSNLFNLLAVLGGAALLAPAGVAVGDGALRLDFPMMIVVALALYPIGRSGGVVDRWEGLALIAAYCVYVGVLVGQGTGLGAMLAVEALVLGLPLAVGGALAAIGWWRGRPGGSVAG